MNNKLYRKEKSKKSFASICLAILLTLSFNASPLLAVSERFNRSANAYKSEQKYVYYPTTSTSTSNSFTANYSSGIENYVSASSNKYNLLEHYNNRFTPLFTEYADRYFAENIVEDYSEKVEAFLKSFNATSISNYFELKKSEYPAQKTIREFVEYFATNTHTSTDTETSETIEVPVLCDSKSEFYQTFYNWILVKVDGKGEYGGFTEDDGITADTTTEQFYNKSVSYKMLKTRLDEELAKDIAIVSQDGVTQNVNVAAIIAEAAPTFIDYNYVKDEYTTYYNINTNAQTVTTTIGEGGSARTEKHIYYFGNETYLPESFRTAYDGFYTAIGDKESAEIMGYYRIQEGQKGYISEEYPTYYKYKSTKDLFVYANSRTTVYVLNDNPSTSFSDTVNSLYFNMITSSDIANTKGFLKDADGNFVEKQLYINVPYESEDIEHNDLYFRTIFDNSLYNKQYDFETFVNLFAPGGESILYVKLNGSTSTTGTLRKTVYIENDQLEAFQAKYPAYDFIVKGTTINTQDYKLITSSDYDYYKSDFELYFERTKEYFYETSYAYPEKAEDLQYEMVTTPQIKYETHDVPSSKYILDSDKKSIQVYAIVLNAETEATLPASFITLTQEEFDTDAKYYQSAPNYHYTDNSLSTEDFALYYKHEKEAVTKIYVVDDSVDSKELAIYTTLNYTVITTNTLKDDYINFSAIIDGDANYNKSFNLYYKFDRQIAGSQLYVLNDNLAVDDELKEEYATNGYKIIKTSDLPNYVALESTDAKYSSTHKLYYKLTDVFVQNEITGQNAIYISDDHISNTDKASYGPKSYVIITSTELKDNASFYKLIGSYDSNYSTSNTKLYYKYVAGAEEKAVYDIKDIDTNAEGYDPSLFELVSSEAEKGYEKYYKKVAEVKQTQKPVFATYNYVSPDITLNADSYYAISFYVNSNVEASVYLRDSENVMEEIAVEKINTNGKWQQYYIFVSTDAVSTLKKVNLYFYLGDKNSIGGSLATDFNYVQVEDDSIYDNSKIYYTYDSQADAYVRYTFNANDWTKENDTYKLNADAEIFVKQSVTGSVAFNEVKVINIGLTDYNKKAIDNVPVENPEKLYKEVPAGSPEGTEAEAVEGVYADDYNNKVILVNNKTEYASNKYEYKTQAEMDVFSTYTWDDMFKFENQSLKDALTNEKLNNALFGDDKDNYNGYDIYENDTTNPVDWIWRYYISRDTKIDYSLEKFKHAFKNGDLEISITDIIDETKIDDEDDKKEEDKKEEDKKEEDKKEDDKKEENKKDEGKNYIATPFDNGNYALKLTNKNTNTELGITSNAFTVKKMDYLKITVWVYSPDKDGTATVSVNTVQPTKNEPVYGTLRTASCSIDANIAAYTKVPTNEYGWIPVYLYIEGSSLRDQDCYLVLNAGKDSVVYFDNITIERITSALYDTANSDSNNNTAALALSPSTSLIATGVTNGNFDLITKTDRNAPVDNELKEAESWTVSTSNSASVKAGIMSMQNTAYFGGKDKVPVDGIDNFSNIYVIDAPKSATSLDGLTINNYKSNYKFNTGSISITAGSVYKLTYKFYKTADFTGTVISNIYTDSKLAATSLITNMDVRSTDLQEGWNTLTYYISTNSLITPPKTIYLELGVKDATGVCYFKSVSMIKETRTYEAIKLEEHKKAGINNGNTANIYETLKTIRFINFAELEFSIHDNNKNEYSDIYSQKEFTHSLTNNNLYTVGKNGSAVASFYTKETITTHSVTIDKTTYYIGEVYEVVVDETTYYVHRTINNNTNKYVYKIYSDADLTEEVSVLNEKSFEISALDSGVKVTIDPTATEPTVVESSKTIYKLFTYSDCTKEIKTISEKEVIVKSLTEVYLGSEEEANLNTATKAEKNSYVYNFGTKDYVINNVIIPASELTNAQSENVLILANGYDTDYQKITPAYKGTVAKASFVALRIYVKTSNFSAANFGLNISVDALSTNWTNVNTTNATNADEYGFVCYEILIKTNSSDAVSNIAVAFSLGEATDKTSTTGSGYAIISNVELVPYATEAEFTHYVESAENNKTTVKKFYDNKSSSSSSSDSDKADDSNTAIWATFFYVFSSLLLVLTMVVAMIALVLKKHPIKFAKKYENDHNKDIEIIKLKKTKGNNVIDELSETSSDDNKEGIL